MNLAVHAVNATCTLLAGLPKNLRRSRACHRGAARQPRFLGCHRL